MINMGKGKLAPIIGINEEKCVNCYACIACCPVKFCMDASGEKLTINHDRCIACGACIDACSHQARVVVDDTDEFFSDMAGKDKFIAVVAPAIATVFPDTYMRLNGYLKSLGVKAVFDVSFGAELTVYSYIRHLKENNPKMIISQPCPAIVNFIELYHPDLLPHLAPVDSPMLHTMKMIREYFPKYSGHKIAVISPCLAKKREFEETGLGDYNVTMIMLKKKLEEKRVSLGMFPEEPYDGPAAERGVLFPLPGGLLETAERFSPGISRLSRKIEGTVAVYHYLDGLAKDLNKSGVEMPKIIDCLNCEMGCLGGPGTDSLGKTKDELESPVRRRSAFLEKQLNPKQKAKLYEKYHETLGRTWKPGLYRREYRNLSANTVINHPSPGQLEAIFTELKKTTETDRRFNCHACGYGACEKMAVAIHNNLNRLENCFMYNTSLLEAEKKAIRNINSNFNANLGGVVLVLGTLGNFVEKLNNSALGRSGAEDKSAAATEKIIISIKELSQTFTREQEALADLISKAAKGQDAMKETTAAFADVSASVDGIASAIKIISVIAANTNLLAMNAAIEAAHAGAAGGGFAVVANEIRRLSEGTRENSRNISQTLLTVIEGIDATSKRTIDTGKLIKDISEGVNGFAGTITGLIQTFGKISSESFEVTDFLNMSKEASDKVKEDYGEMLELLAKLRSEMGRLSEMSSEIAAATGLK